MPRRQTDWLLITLLAAWTAAVLLFALDQGEPSPVKAPERSAR